MTLEHQTQLMRQALAGNRLAAERLLEPHRQSVLRVAYRALGNRDDAADVAQEALVYALLRLGDLRDPARFSGWLRQITLSQCADYRRRRGTRRLGTALAVLDEAGEEADFAQRILLRQALAHLSADHQAAFLLHYVGGWSLEEVAGLTNVPVNTVRSRLMAAKRLLRHDLHALLPSMDVQPEASNAGLPLPQKRGAHAKGNQMSADTPVLPQPQNFETQLSETHRLLIENAFPGARLLSVQNDPEMWQPFTPRVRLVLRDGSERIADFRNDITPERANLLSLLLQAHIPGPQILHGPVQTANGYLTLCDIPRGENLTLWTLGGTPHRIRLATERAFEGIDRLQGATNILAADPVGSLIPRRTLADEVEILTENTRWNAEGWLAEAGAERGQWLADPWFANALRKVQTAIADIRAPLVYTDYTFFFPQNYRIAPETGAANEPLGWPGDPHYQENPLVEFAMPFGHLGDPLLGLAMVWVYDCYPFVHTGFVEQFLWKRGVTRREFAPRLGLKALQMVARDLPLTPPADGKRYWESLRSWVEQAISWM